MADDAVPSADADGTPIPEPKEKSQTAAMADPDAKTPDAVDTAVRELDTKLKLEAKSRWKQDMKERGVSYWITEQQQMIKRRRLWLC